MSNFNELFRHFDCNKYGKLMVQAVQTRREYRVTPRTPNKYHYGCDSLKLCILISILKMCFSISLLITIDYN